MKRPWPTGGGGEDAAPKTNNQKKSMVSAKPIFAQPTITRCIFVQFYINRAENVENTAKISFRSLS